MDRQTLGVTLYSEQQELALAQAQLEQLNQNLQAHTAQRLCREAEMDSLRKLYKNVANEADASKRQGLLNHFTIVDSNSDQRVYGLHFRLL